MESLLSLGFDHISSKNPKKLGKGLRQIEGLLAQICLSSSSSTSSQSPSKRTASTITSVKSAKQLDMLVDDLAFKEFFRLQNSFEWNVATRLVECLDRLLGMGKTDQNDDLIAFALDILQGILLLHPPSRTLFGRERNMTLLLDLLDPHSSPLIHRTTVLVLVTALLSHPHNTRVFERTSGILTLTSLFKSRTASQELKLKIVEFFYFYLMHETPPTTLPSTHDPAAIMAASVSSAGGVALNNVQRLPGSKNAVAPLQRSVSMETNATAVGDTKTTEEKQVLLGKYFSNVEDLVQDLRENGAFAERVC